MKKLVITIGFILVAKLTFAQYFTLTPKGLVSGDKNSFVVVDFPNAKQAVLYKNVLNALNTMYKNPKEVLSLVDGESITITAYEKGIITDKVKVSPLQVGKKTYKYDLSYTLSILFKDGKIRFNSPSFECKRHYESGYKSGYASGWTDLPLIKGKDYKSGVFSENGKVFSDEAFEGLSKHFNGLIKEIIDKTKNGKDW